MSSVSTRPTKKQTINIVIISFTSHINLDEIGNKRFRFKEKSPYFE
jgi:hypothetical protein